MVYDGWGGLFVHVHMCFGGHCHLLSIQICVLEAIRSFGRLQLESLSLVTPLYPQGSLWPEGLSLVPPLYPQGSLWPESLSLVPPLYPQGSLWPKSLS